MAADSSVRREILEAVGFCDLDEDDASPVTLGGYSVYVFGAFEDVGVPLEALSLEIPPVFLRVLSRTIDSLASVLAQVDWFARGYEEVPWVE